MARDGAIYVCQACGGVANRWQGQCADCAEWNTLVEEAPATVFSEKHNLSGGGRAFAFEALDEPLTRAHEVKIAIFRKERNIRHVVEEPVKWRIEPYLTEELFARCQQW